MADERNEAQEQPGEDDYEAPAVEDLGSTVEATAGDTNFSLHDSNPSDGRLKDDIAPLERPLERLRAIRTH